MFGYLTHSTKPNTLAVLVLFCFLCEVVGCGEAEKS